MSSSSSTVSSAFTPKTTGAFRTTAIVTEFKGVITSLVHYSDRVLIGSEDGRLVLYDLRRGQQGPVASKSFSHRRKIDEIIAIPHIRSVLVLSDGNMSVYTATDLEPSPSAFNDYTQVKTFCVNQRGPPLFRVCIALRRKLMLFEHKEAEGQKQYVPLREFDLTDTPERMVWYRNKLCLAFRKDYQIMNDKSGEKTVVKGITPDANKGIPLVKLLPGKEILVTALDKVGVLINSSGEPLQKNSISWSNAPSAFTYSAPYLISFVAKTGVEIHSMLDHSVVQSIPFPSITALSGNGMKWDMEPRAPGDPEDVVILATSKPSIVYKLESLPMDQHIGDMLDRGKVDEARDFLKRSIASLPIDKQKSKLRRFDKQAGVGLLRRLEFRRAVVYLTKGELDPRELLAFFPEHRSESFVYEPTVLKPEVLPRGDSAKPDMVDVIAAGHRRKMRVDVSKKQLLNEASKALLEILEYHVMTDVGSTSKRKKPDSRTRSAMNNAFFRLCVIHGRKELLDRLMKDRSITSDVAVKEAESLLKRYKLHNELAKLYSRQDLHREALKVYEDIGTGQVDGSEADATNESIKLLLRVKDEGLVWRYSAWIIENNSTEGMNLLSDRTPPLQSEKIVSHLKKINPDLAKKYLETVGDTRSSRKESRRAAAHSSSPSPPPPPVSLYERAEHSVEERSPGRRNSSNQTQLALEYLEDVLLCIDNGEKPSSSAPGSEAGSLGKARRKLNKFLQSSRSNYDSELLLSKVKKSPLSAEYLILCGKAEKHEEALRILTSEKYATSSVAAEEYCLNYGIPSCPNPAMLMLLKIYLKQGHENKKSNFRDFGLSLLERHANSLDIQSVLEVLPEDILLNDIEVFLSQALPRSVHQARQEMVTRSLSNIYNLQVQCQQATSKQRYSEVNNDTICMACRKRIGDLVFAVYPNDTIVHYNCTNGNLDQCPVTGETFQ